MSNYFNIPRRDRRTVSPALILRLRFRLGDDHALVHSQTWPAKYRRIGPLVWQVEAKHSIEILFEAAFRGVRAATIFTVTLQQGVLKAQSREFGLDWLTAVAIQHPAFFLIPVLHR